VSRNDVAFDNLWVRGTNSGLSGLENDAFARLWARGKKATAPTGRTGAAPAIAGGPGGATADGGVSINSYCKYGVMEEVIDLGGATSVTSTNDLLPANSILGMIVCTPVRDFTTPTTYDVGDTTTATRFATSLTNDNVSEGPAYAKAHLTGTVAHVQTSAAKVKIRPNTAGSGLLHVAVFYQQYVGAA